ncbi:hypothetical protein LTR95_003861 [Oleoguttula sp. CCFEE 5521]
MDPVGTLLSIAALALIIDDLCGAYAEAPRTLAAIRLQIKILETCLLRVQEWLHFTDPTTKAQIMGSINDATFTVDSALQALRADLTEITGNGSKTVKVLGRQGSDQWTKTKFAWNEARLRRHLTDMRECASLMHFVLAVCQLPSGRSTDLEIKEVGIGARKLSRVYKSTRSARRPVLVHQQSQDPVEQSTDFKQFMAAVTAAEEDLVTDPTTDAADEPGATSGLDDSPAPVVVAEADATPSTLGSEALLCEKDMTPFEIADRTESLPEVVHSTDAGDSASKLPIRPAKSPLESPLLRSTPAEVLSIGGPSSHAENESPKANVTSLESTKVVPRKPVRRKSTVESAALRADLVIELDGAALGTAQRESRSTEEHKLPTRGSEDSTGEPLSPAIWTRNAVTHSDSVSSSGSYIHVEPDTPPPYAAASSDRIGTRTATQQRRRQVSSLSTNRRTSGFANLGDIKINPQVSDCSALLQAVKMDDEDKVIDLLSQGADPEDTEPGIQRTALLEAARLARREMCRVLIRAGSQVHVSDINGCTALHLCAGRGDALIGRMLIDAGAQLEAYDRKGRTPLQVAAESGRTEFVMFVLEHTPKRGVNDPGIIKALHQSVKMGDVASAREFLAHDVKLKKLKDSWKLTSYAAQSGNLQMLEFVIGQKISLKEKSPDGWTALHFAAKHGHTAMVERLLDMQISCRSQTKKSKELALHMAVHQNFPDTAIVLMSHKDASVTTADADGQEALHHAVRNGDVRLVTQLLAHDAKLKSQNGFGWRPVHLAAAYGQVELLTLFLTHGVDINAQLGKPDFKPAKRTNAFAIRGYWAEIRWPHEGATALDLAIEFGQVEAAKLLLAAGAKIEDADSQRWRPLHYAAFHVQPELVELLLAKGASPAATTADGNTPHALGYREHGLTASQEDKDHIHYVLQAAASTSKKSAWKAMTEYRLGSANSRTARERNQAWHTAEMADMLYRDKEVDDGEDDLGTIASDGLGIQTPELDSTLSLVSTPSPSELNDGRARRRSTMSLSKIHT